MKNFVTPNSHPSSFLTGSTVEAMVDKFKELDTGYCVCTDNGYLTNTLKVYNLAKKKGLKPILGCEIYIKDNSLSDKVKYYTITIHARNQEQYQYLVKQLSDKTRATIEILEQEYPLFNMKDLEVFAEKGFVAVIGGPQCIVSKNLLVGEHQLALNTFIKLSSIFSGNFYASIIPMKFDKKWVTSSVFTFSDGETARLDSTIIAETDYAKTFRIPLKEVAEKYDKHKSIKKLYVNGIGYRVNRDIASAYNNKDFKPIGVDVYEKYNKFIKACCNRYNIPMLINDYSYLAKKDDKLVQDLKLGEEIRLSVNYHICNINDVLPTLSAIYDQLEIEKMIQNSYDFASKFDDFDLNYSYQLVKEHDNHLKATLDLIKKVGRFDESNPVHRERLQHEIKVINGNGEIDLLPYFFPISRVINYYKEKGRIVGPARGCLTKDTLVYTKNGVKNLNEIKVGDYVVSHTGQWRQVLDTMVYDVNEELLNIKTEYSYNPNTMTKDHKVYGIKRTIIDGHTSKTKKYEDWNEKDVKWYKAEEMKEGDLLFTPWPSKSEIEIPKKIDIAKYFKNKKYDESYVYIEKPLYNKFSLIQIAKNTGLSKGVVKRLKENGNCREYNVKKIEEYLLKHNTSIKEWQKNKNTKTLKIKRFIDFDKKLCNFIGRWIGDGWLTKQNNGIGICFNTDEKKDIEYYISYLKSLGWEIYEYRSKNKKAIQYTIKNSEIWTLFRKMFPNYNFTSDSKHMSFWKKIPEKNLKWVLEGLLGADGCVRNNQQSSFQKEAIDTTSKVLVEDIRESLLSLKIPSSIYVREPFVRKQKNKEYLCKKSYKILFIGIGVERSNYFNFSTEKGYFSKITKINKKIDNKVYDITVEKDHSYTTVDYVVHNSAGGSFLMYCMGITQVDPVKYGLHFSRFLTVGRILSGSLPDVDVDLNSRDLLIEKNGFFNTYYNERWAQVSTRTIMKLKSSIRDVNRFKFGKVEGDIERFAKNLEATPQGISDADFVFGYEDNEGNHVPGLLDRDDKLRAYTQERPEEWEIVKRTLGISRQNGRHASAFVISNKSLTDIIPTMKVSGHENITQYEAKEVEEAGLIKYDFLIIKVLNDIQLAIENINKKNYYSKDFSQKDYTIESGHLFHNNQEIYIWDLPEEPEVFDMLGEGKTETVFQLNTVSVTPYVMKMKPRSVEDCAVVTSLVRPGPLDFINEETGRNMAEEYVERVNGRSQGDIEILNELIPETQGVFVFQEQVSKVTKKLTGWDDEKAEDVRIAVGKKKLRMIQELRPQFINASVQNGIEEEIAKNVWEMIETFGRYGFNKSHAVAYSMIAYACAYLKYHYPLEWWAAVLSNAEEKEITEVLWPHVKNILSPPDINLSNEEMVIDYGTNKIRNKLSALRGLGEKVADKIIKNRPYKDIHDFTQKQVVGNSLARKLIHAGVMDSLFPESSTLIEKMQLFENSINVWKYKKKMHIKSDKEIPLDIDLSDFISQAKINPKTKKCKHVIPDGKVDLKYACMNPIKDFVLKKSIFPTMPIDLYSILKENTKTVKVINTSKSSFVLGKNKKEVRFVHGNVYQNIKNIPVQPGNFTTINFCMSGYIVECREFSYQNGNKKALKLTVDIDGNLEEFVKWSDYDTGKLVYPENLKKGCVVFLFMSKKMYKEKFSINIEDIIIENIF